MKQQHSPTGYGDDSYNILSPKKFPFVTLHEAADTLKIRKPRMSRILRILQIPVHKVGTLVLVDDEGVKRARQALKTGEIKRGRKIDASG